MKKSPAASVQKSYNKIAAQFAASRLNLKWTVLNDFLEYIPAQGNVLDLGCGSGRLIPWLAKVRPEINYLGVDFSKNLLKEAAQTAQGQPLFKTDFKLASATKLGLASNSQTVILAIAIYHHLPPREISVALEESYRVLKPGGYLCLTVWNLWRWSWSSKTWWRALVRGQLVSPQGVNTYWQGRQVLYYYALTKGQLGRLLGKAGFEVVFLGYDQPKDSSAKAGLWKSSNLVAIVKKIG